MKLKHMLLSLAVAHILPGPIYAEDGDYWDDYQSNLNALNAIALEEPLPLESSINAYWASSNYTAIIETIDSHLAADPRNLFALCLKMRFYDLIEKDYDRASSSAALVMAEIESRTDHPDKEVAYALAKGLTQDPPHASPQTLAGLHKFFKEEFPFIIQDRLLSQKLPHRTKEQNNPEEFVLHYAYDPSALAPYQAIQEATSWLQLLDENKYEIAFKRTHKIHQEFDIEGRKGTDLSSWAEDVRRYRHYSPVQNSRRVVETEQFRPPINAPGPKGPCFRITFYTETLGGEAWNESVLLTDDNGWKVVGYFPTPTNIE